MHMHFWLYAIADELYNTLDNLTKKFFFTRAALIQHSSFTLTASQTERCDRRTRGGSYAAMCYLTSVVPVRKVRPAIVKGVVLQLVDRQKVETLAQR